MSRSILKQTSQMSIFGLLSRFIAFFREFLLIQFLGVSASSDIFFTAFRIPNTLRKIFAEGALSSVLVPALINAEHKRSQSGLNKLTTLSFLVIGSIIISFCLFVFFSPLSVLNIIVPGWSKEKIELTSQLLQILISFILFMSSGAIFSAALQSNHKFFVPATSPAILNVCYVISLLACLYFRYSITTFCYYMIGISAFFFLIHLVAYFQAGFTLQAPDRQTFKEFSIVLMQFLPCVLSIGILEISHFIDTMFGSYLPDGSLTLMRYAFQFVNIPLGLIAASLSTVLLPHFSKTTINNPEKLNEQLFEAIKFILWSTIPLYFLLAFFSQEIFQTLFLFDAEAIAKVPAAQTIFLAYLSGLIFFSINKIFLSIFYALRLTMIPLFASLLAIGLNIVLNQLLISWYQAAGIALASAISAGVQSAFYLFYLHNHLKLHFHIKEYLNFFITYGKQLLLLFSCFWLAYRGIYHIINQFNFTWNLYVITIDKMFFLKSLGVWMWAGPLSLVLLWLIYVTRNKQSLSLAYFDEKEAKK